MINCLIAKSWVTMVPYRPVRVPNSNTRPLLELISRISQFKSIKANTDQLAYKILKLNISIWICICTIAMDKNQSIQSGRLG